MTKPKHHGETYPTIKHRHPRTLTRDEIARRIAADIPVGVVVNLGIGMPTLVSNYLSPEDDVTLHTENGMLGMGPVAVGDDIDPDLTNAGKIPVTELPGCAFLDHAESFAIMRGHHLDIAVLGAFQVSARGDIANWATDASDAIPSVGGAMDLATGAKQVFVAMEFFAKDGVAKVVSELSYPVTGLRCVHRAYTEVALFDFDGHGNVRVTETYGEMSMDALSRATGIDLIDATD